MTSEAPQQQKQPIRLDAIEGLEVSHDNYSNELGSLRTLLAGMKRLYGSVKSREVQFAQATGGKLIVHSYGAASGTDEEREFLDTVACMFHWFGNSVCNYARLVGYIRGMWLGHFSRADFKDPTRFKQIKSSIDTYINDIKELENVRIWRNKVFAHFAITDPYKDDTIATLDMSVIFPVSFDGHYVVGGMTLMRKDSTGSYVSGLPRWSITEVFEELEPRFWPGLKFEIEQPPTRTEPLAS